MNTMSMAMKYALQKRAKKGGCSGPDCAGCGDAMCMAEGGMVGEEMASGYEPMPMPKEDGDDDDGSEGIVDRIMKRFAKGGEVEPVADFESNDFEVEPDGDEFSETGANSGDKLGDKAEDDDQDDIVSRVMKSRGKKDKMPRPA